MLAGHLHSRMEEETFLLFLRDSRVNVNATLGNVTALGVCLDRPFPIWKKTAQFLLNDPRTSLALLHFPTERIPDNLSHLGRNPIPPLWHAANTDSSLLNEMLRDPRITISEEEIDRFNKDWRVCYHTSTSPH